MRRTVVIPAIALLAACGGVSPGGPVAYVVLRAASGGSSIARYDGVPPAPSAESPLASGDVTAFAARDPSNGDVVWVHAGNRSGFANTRWQVDLLDADLRVVRTRPDSEILAGSGVFATAVEGPGIVLADAHLLVFTAVALAPKASPGFLVLDRSTLSYVGFIPTLGVYGDPAVGPSADAFFFLGVSPTSPTGQRIFEADARQGAVVDSAIAGPAQALVVVSDPAAICVVSSDSIRVIDPVSGSVRQRTATDVAGPVTVVPNRWWIVTADASVNGAGGVGVVARDGSSLGLVGRFAVLPDTIAAGATSVAADRSGRYLWVTSATSGASSASFLSVVDLETEQIDAVVRLPASGELLPNEP